MSFDISCILKKSKGYKERKMVRKIYRSISVVLIFLLYESYITGMAVLADAMLLVVLIRFAFLPDHMLGTEREHCSLPKEQRPPEIRLSKRFPEAVPDPAAR